MTEQLREMKARLEAATPGRWNFDADGWLQSDDPSMDYILFPGAYTVDEVQMLIVNDQDADFIAHAPEVQAKLIAALEGLLEWAAVLDEHAKILNLDANRVAAHLRKIITEALA